MFGQVFYFDLIRKYIILVGTLMDGINITRTDVNGNQTGLLKVPVMYAPKDKMLARVIEDPGINRQTATEPLPLISFEMGPIHYDAPRKLTTVGKIAYKANTSPATQFAYQYNPVPYNFDFKVYIYAKNAEDGTKILEQILPYFTPDWTTTLRLIPEVEEEKDIPVLINNVSYEDNYSGDFSERRAIIWTLSLTVKGWLYGPIKTAPIINFINTEFFVGDAASNANNGPVSAQTLQPGLDANNNPTSNISITIPLNQIEATDNYGFITGYNQYVK